MKELGDGLMINFDIFLELHGKMAWRLGFPFPDVTVMTVIPPSRCPPSHI